MFQFCILLYRWLLLHSIMILTITLIFSKSLWFFNTNKCPHQPKLGIIKSVLKVYYVRFLVNIFGHSKIECEIRNASNFFNTFYICYISFQLPKRVAFWSLPVFSFCLVSKQKCDFLFLLHSCAILLSCKCHVTLGLKGKRQNEAKYSISKLCLLPHNHTNEKFHKLLINRYDLFYHLTP